MGLVLPSHNPREARTSVPSSQRGTAEASLNFASGGVSRTESTLGGGAIMAETCPHIRSTYASTTVADSQDGQLTTNGVESRRGVPPRKGWTMLERGRGRRCKGAAVFSRRRGLSPPIVSDTHLRTPAPARLHQDTFSASAFGLAHSPSFISPRASARRAAFPSLLNTATGDAPL